MSSDDKALFSNFGKSFQEKIVQALLLDRQWASQFLDVVKPEYFEPSYLQKMVDKYISYHKKYKDFPSLQLMIDMMKEEIKTGVDSVLRDQIIDCIKRIAANKDLGDLAYVKEKSLDYCRRMELKRAFMQSLDLIEQNNYESIIGIVKKAMSLGDTNTPGMDLVEDVEARYIANARKTIATGIPQLDCRDILNGGLGVGELGIIMAASKIGKSHNLVQFGANALLQGKNVLYFTYELREIPTGIRFDSNLVDISSSECYERKEEIATFYKNNKNKLGKLKIKYFPAGTVTTNQLGAYMEKIALEGFYPDLVIVDYLQLMRSTEKTDMLRIEIKKVCEELRSLADEYSVAIWSALQGNRGAYGDNDISLENASESLGSVQTCDIILGLHRKAQDKLTGLGSLSVLGNRIGQDGHKFSVKIDTSKSKITVLTDDQAKELTQDEQEVTSESIREAYKRTQNQGKVDLTGLNVEKLK